MVESNFNLLSFYKVIKDYIALVLGLAALLLGFKWLYGPPIQLVWRCLSLEKRFPLGRTLEACLACIWPFKPKVFRQQMRLWLELGLLRPRPSREIEWYYDRDEMRYQSEIKDQEYKREVREWKSDVKRKFGTLKIKETEPVIEISDCFRLNDEVTENGIKQYLRAVTELGLDLDQNAAFLCKVKINEGFLLPLSLLAGLMARFQDDWDPIIESYSYMAKHGFSPLQASIFDLWLLWGPSVPICTCEQWSGPITLQYGFGDEDNSVRVYVTGEAKRKLLEELKNSVKERKTNAYPAIHVSITGRLRSPSSFIRGDMCAAQHELLNPNNLAFIIEYGSHNVRGNRGGSNLFYSAYVWALFIISWGEKPTIEEIKKEPWLKILPFFEHANIADSCTYMAGKIQLAHKVLTFVKQLVDSEVNRGQEPLRLWYQCAIDDSGCGETIAVPPQGQSIREIIEWLLESDEYRSLQEHLVFGDHSFRGILSGCHIEDTVSEFFKEVEQLQNVVR